MIPLSCKKEESEKEKQGEVGRETENKRDLKQMKRVSFTIYINYREAAHSCEWI